MLDDTNLQQGGMVTLEAASELLQNRAQPAWLITVDINEQTRKNLQLVVLETNATDRTATRVELPQLDEGEMLTSPSLPRDSRDISRDSFIQELQIDSRIS